MTRESTLNQLLWLAAYWLLGVSVLGVVTFILKWVLL